MTTQTEHSIDQKVEGFQLESTKYIMLEFIEALQVRFSFMTAPNKSKQLII